MDPGSYILNVNGQKLEIKVRGSNKIVDNFKDENLNEYSGNLGAFSTDSTRSINDDVSLYTTTTNGNIIYTSPDDSNQNLNYYPQKGDKIEFYDYKTDRSRRIRFDFGYDHSKDTGFSFIWFGNNISGNKQHIELREQDSSGNIYKYDNKKLKIPLDVWIKYTIDFNDKITINIQKNDDQTNLATITAIPESFYNNRGIGIGTGATGGKQWIDSISIIN